MQKIVLTGSQGFIGSYVSAELLNKGYKVLGVDNYSKYGEVGRPHDKHPNFILEQFDIIQGNLFRYILEDFRPDYVIAGAAKIGGISYFHKYAYDLIAENERIIATTFDACLRARPNRVIVLSSSMVYESDPNVPNKEEGIGIIPPPVSSYGFQKLATEYFAKAAWEQYKLPYTIIRPFNCVGVGEEDAIGESEVTSGNVKMMMSHVLPDLINKVLKGQDPLHILGKGNQIRCYTNGKDIARGIRLAMESDKAVNEAFNISTPQTTTVLELAEMVWRKINGNKPFRYVSDDPYPHDVQVRHPSVTKAKEILGFEAEISLEESVDEVIEYMRERV